jgi:hypothetical protein
MVGQTTNTWKEAVVVLFEALPENLLGENEKNHEKSSIKTAGLRVEI